MLITCQLQDKKKTINNTNIWRLNNTLLNNQKITEVKMFIETKENETCLTSGSTTKPQSLRQYGTGTKTEIQINGTELKAQR